MYHKKRCVLYDPIYCTKNWFCTVQCTVQTKPFVQSNMLHKRDDSVQFNILYKSFVQTKCTVKRDEFFTNLLYKGFGFRNLKCTVQKYDFVQLNILYKGQELYKDQISYKGLVSNKSQILYKGQVPHKGQVLYKGLGFTTKCTVQNQDHCTKNSDI